MSWDWNSKKIKRIIIDLLPLVICAMILVSFVSSDWFKDWLGGLPNPQKALVLGSTLAVIGYERLASKRF